MKVTINTTEPQSREIDWSKKMIVTDGDRYVRTTGEHTDGTFDGMDVITGTYTSWTKHNFTPCTTPVTITFENEL